MIASIYLLHYILSSLSIYVSSFVKFMERVGRYSVFSIATPFALQSPGINYKLGASFFALAQTDQMSHSNSSTKNTCFFPGKNKARLGGHHPLHLAPKLGKE